MKKFIISLTLVLLISCSFTVCGFASEATDQLQKKMDAAHMMAEGARGLGYPESCDVIQLAKAEWEKYHTELVKQREIEKNSVITDSTYPVAATVWNYLKNKGMSNYVIAGIVGNMMTECGGQTLKLNATITSPGGSFYGLCQWSKRYYPSVYGADVNGQLDFLMSNIKYEIDTYGYKYKSGFKYNNFLQLTNEKNAALAFAKAYERCGSSSYSTRQKNATIAYNYFVK